jgi:hypothetical protein
MHREPVTQPCKKAIISTTTFAAYSRLCSQTPVERGLFFFKESYPHGFREHVREKICFGKNMRENICFLESFHENMRKTGAAQAVRKYVVFAQN